MITRELHNLIWLRASWATPRSESSAPRPLAHSASRGCAPLRPQLDFPLVRSTSPRAPPRPFPLTHLPFFLPSRALARSLHLNTYTHTHTHSRAISAFYTIYNFAKAPLSFLILITPGMPMTRSRPAPALLHRLLHRLSFKQE